MKLFEKVEVVTNKGDTCKRLELRQNKSLAAEIIAFIDTFLFKLIFHRNDLQHHRSTIHQLSQQFTEASIHMDLDLAENLTIPIRESPQQMHWHKKQVVTVHSGILNMNGDKEYHPYMTSSWLV